MNRLQLMRDLHDIKMKFHSNNYNLQTIVRIVSFIRRNRFVLDKKIILRLLEIPINILDNDVKLKIDSKFNISGGYFAGNIFSTDIRLLAYKEMFSTLYYTFTNLIDYTKVIYEMVEHNEIDIAKLEYLLRNIEVVLRDDVEVSAYTNFKTSGPIYEKFIDNIINNILINELSCVKSDDSYINDNIIPKYDIALSFAGEDRFYAYELAKILKLNEVKVFYDDYQVDTLWGVNLYDYLSSIYKNQAKFCVMFISKHYATKLWTNHERKSAQARAFLEDREYILPIRLDDTSIPGVHETIGYIDYDKYETKEIADMIIRKVKNLK